jgi:hypothetical protein
MLKKVIGTLNAVVYEHRISQLSHKLTAIIPRKRQAERYGRHDRSDQ